ncbi:MAG: hypothetical protein GF404_12605 [candidate division Zixibacteria bacterium]|nr:hypothetical protein [candidate division Zixibacteria bacterium]
MKKCTIIITFLVLLTSLSAQPGTDPEPFETALNAVGLEKEKLSFDYGDMANYGGDRFYMPLFYTLHSAPFKVEKYSKQYRGELTRQCRNLMRMSAFASHRVGLGVRRGLIDNPLDRILPFLEEEFSLYDAIVKFEALYAIPMDQKKREELWNATNEVPVELQKMAAVIIYSCIDSNRYHRQAFLEAREEFDLHEMFTAVPEYFTSEETGIDFQIEELIEEVDLKYLFTPAQDIALGIDYAVDSLSKLNFTSDFEFEWETSAGKIVIKDGRSHSYDDDRYFLIIDVGGNDTYKNAASNRDLSNWISIAIDMGGNDIYDTEGEDYPAFGTGLFGYAYLVDMAGDDTYRGKNLTQGVGIFGVGILQDLSGNDSYDGYISGQGAGFCGQGILSDITGDDRYHMFQMGQGFGFTRGAGILVDSTGNDRYIANDSIIDFPSSQSEDHNSNLCQGVGFGKRADFIDGHSWAGGIGILVDASGNDHYSAGLFAQGCAYWYAIGLLADTRGDDVYEGVWYVQGSGAHFGLGIMLESDGDDRYTATHNMAQGAGHDFTLGWLIDEAGNDIYIAPNLSLGGGNANGIGIFWDKRGNDQYFVEEATTLGRSNVASRGSLRDTFLNLGLFLDTGGEDVYPEEYEFAKNNSLWTQPGKNTDQPLETEKGVGYDCECTE